MLREAGAVAVHRIDEQYLETPYFGSRRMAKWFASQGEAINRKRAVKENKG